MDDVMPGRDGLENLSILKKSQLGVDIGPWRQRKFEFLPLTHRVGFFTVTAAVKFFGSIPTEILNIARCAACWWGQII